MESKELKENNFTYIKFTGGEPFTRDDMIEILKYARNLGFDMDISTNGSLITEKIAKELKNMSFPMVHVSLDGENKKSHEYVRGENTFERTLRGIKHLTENRDYAVNFINNNIPQLHAYRPKATYLLYVDIKDLNCTAVELVDFLKKEVKLSVVPGGHNYFGNQSEGHVRICIATSKGILHEGLNRLKLGVEKFVSQKG